MGIEMQVKYRIVVKGIKSGYTERQVQDAIIDLLKGDPEDLRTKTKLDGSFYMRMPDLPTAREWSARLDALGCENEINPNPDAPPLAPSELQGFHKAQAAAFHQHCISHQV